MSIYTLLVNGYHNLLLTFPPAVGWMITLAVLAGLIYLFISLIRTNILFVIVLILFLPFLLPVLFQFLADIWYFFLYILSQVGLYHPGYTPPVQTPIPLTR